MVFVEITKNVTNFIRRKLAGHNSKTSIPDLSPSPAHHHFLGQIPPEGDQLQLSHGGLNVGQDQIQWQQILYGMIINQGTGPQSSPSQYCFDKFFQDVIND